MLRVTKYEHSCLLVETTDRVALIDPGGFSWESGSFDIDLIDRIDRILITHVHGDHYDRRFVEAVLTKFPKAQIVANAEVQSKLKKDGIAAGYRDSTMCSAAFASDHESIVALGGAGSTPQNTGFHFMDQLTHPGDSHSFIETKATLAMPFVAPWGSAMSAIDKVMDLKPKRVIPIHDWHYSDEAKDWLYGILGPKLKKAGIELVVLENGKPQDIG